MKVPQFTEDDRAAIRRVIAFAKAHPVPLDVVARCAVEHKQPVDDSRHEFETDDYRAAFMVEEQPPGPHRHLVVMLKVGLPGALPSIRVVTAFMEAFGFRRCIQHAMVFAQNSPELGSGVHILEPLEEPGDIAH